MNRDVVPVTWGWRGANVAHGYLPLPDTNELRLGDSICGHATAPAVCGPPGRRRCAHCVRWLTLYGTKEEA